QTAPLSVFSPPPAIVPPDTPATAELPLNPPTMLGLTPFASTLSPPPVTPIFTSLSAVHPHAVPFHFSNWPVAQLVIKLSVTVPPLLVLVSPLDESVTTLKMGVGGATSNGCGCVADAGGGVCGD